MTRSETIRIQRSYLWMGNILASPWSITTKPAVISVKYSSKGNSKFIGRPLAKLSAAWGQRRPGPWLHDSLTEFRHRLTSLAFYVTAWWMCFPSGYRSPFLMWLVFFCPLLLSRPILPGVILLDGWRLASTCVEIFKSKGDYFNESNRANTFYKDFHSMHDITRLVWNYFMSETSSWNVSRNLTTVIFNNSWLLKTR